MPTGQYQAVFDPAFCEDLAHWAAADRNVLRRALALVETALRTPSEGAGQPKPLKELPGTWSRRVTVEHRVVYCVAGDRVYFLQARYY